jgi:energy-coupling factor transport system permease protein
MSNITSSAKNMVSYNESDAIMWHVDPRIKLLWAIVTITLSIFFRSPIPVFIVCLQVFILSMVFGYPVFREISNNKSTFIFLVGIIGISNLLFAGFVKGEVIINIDMKLFNIVLTDNGILYAVTVTLRLVAIFLVMLILTTTTRMTHLTSALERLGLPYKFCFLFSLTWRLIPVVAEGVEVTTDAQRTRGFEMEKGTLKHKFIAFQRVIKPTFILLGNSVRDMTLAYISKGVDTSVKGRTSLWEPNFIKSDYFLLVFSILILGLGIFLKFSHIFY